MYLPEALWQASVMAAYTHFGSEVNVDSMKEQTSR